MTADCRCGGSSYRPDTVTGRRQALRCLSCHRVVGRCECVIGRDNVLHIGRSGEEVIEPMVALPPPAAPGLRERIERLRDGATRNGENGWADQLRVALAETPGEPEP